MKVLFDAIMTKYNASTVLKAANTGGLYRERVPQKVRFPFMVMHHLDGRPKDTFSAYIENYTIQFNIYDNNTSDDNVDAIFSALSTAFDYCALTITGYTHVVMRRVFSNSFYDEEAKTWQYVVQYEIEMQKS